jgi:parallel beta-helix repeat protein
MKNSMSSYIVRLVIAGFCFALIVGCGSDDETAEGGNGQGVQDTREDETISGDDGDGETGDAKEPKTEFEAFDDSCTKTTGPSGVGAEETTRNLERALVNLESGDVVCLVNGDYMVSRQLTIPQNGVTLMGESQSETVLNFENQSGANGILAEVSKNFAIRNLTVKNTASDAIKAKGTDGVVMKNVTVTWDAGVSEENGAYGLYPVEAKNVLIEGCKVSYARDAGVYLGQSDTAIIRDNEAFGNVVGIEIENTFRAAAYNNHAHDNADGFLIINLPNLDVKGGARNLIYDNEIVNNNERNFGESGTAVSKMPSGSGLVLVASDNNEIRDNTIENNNSVGIGVASYVLIEQGGSDDDAYDPYPEGNWIHNNTLVGNGTDPKGRAVIAAGEDGTVSQTFWDGNFDKSKDNSDGSLTNCFESNVNDNDESVEFQIIDTTSKCPEESGGEGASFCENDCAQSKVESVELPQRVMDMAQ